MRKAKIIVFIVALIVGLTFAKIFAFSLGLHLPSVNVFSKTRGSGRTQTEQRNVSNFSQIKVSGAIAVEVAASQKDFSVETEADDNLLQYVKTEVSGDTLRIYTEGRISTSNPIRVRISMPKLESFDVSGASSGDLTGINNENLTIDASGASKIKIEGTAKELRVDLSGASRLDSENLKSENVWVEASGASNATVYASNEINAEASGASCIRYAGNPKEANQSSSGASSVKQK